MSTIVHWSLPVITRYLILLLLLLRSLQFGVALLVGRSLGLAGLLFCVLEAERDHQTPLFPRSILLHLLYLLFHSAYSPPKQLLSPSSSRFLPPFLARKTLSTHLITRLRSS